MKKFYLLLSTVFITMISACINEDVGVDLRVGERLPDFEVEMNDGRTVNNKDLIGSVSVIMFFHTTCPDCQQALPLMQRIYDEYLQEGIKFALISREQNEMEISTYWNDNGLKMPFSAQMDREVYEKFATSRIPRIYINDENGIIRHIYTDNPVPSYEDLQYALDSVISSLK